MNATIEHFVKGILKFAVTSGIATLIDYTLFIILSNFFFDPIISNVISYSCAMLANFFLQRRFIFQLNRKISTTFALSATFSLIGIGISTLLIYLLVQIPFLFNYPLLAKIITTGIIFFYNYFTKRFAFQGLS